MGDRTDQNMHGERGQGEDFEFARLMLLLWNSKVWILACTALMTALGVGYAIFATPTYYSQAIITLKEVGKGSDASRIFSQLGGMGGVVASQLGMGNTSLDKIEVILKSHELARRVIEVNNLMPTLFPDQWNKTDSAWILKDSARHPVLREGIRKLREDILAVSLDIKKNMIKVGANYHDPRLAKEFVELYLAELNRKIRNDVVNDAETNRAYLEKQLSNTSDPILIEKIHGMIGFEIEKSMLVSSQAFEVLDRPVEPATRSKPKRTIIVLISVMAGIFSSVISVFLWSALAGLKSTAAEINLTNGSSSLRKRAPA